MSPAGRAALAVVHVGGEGAGEFVQPFLGRRPDDTPRFGRLREGGEVLDEVVARRVSGLTGEETVELTLHGGPVGVERVMRALEARGAARLDHDGFLDRAVATGALDVLRAEAWRRLPGAATELAALVLQDQADGALSRAVAAMATLEDAERLLATAPLGIALASPPRVALTGRPNAGKSTLFNALLGRERALVSPVPGTTRDPVRELLSIRQVPVELVDTAGIERPRDELEAQSIERARRAAAGADLVIRVVDAAAPPGEDAVDAFLGLRVANKVDVAGAVPAAGAVAVSARTGEGIDALREAVLEALGIRPCRVEGGAVVFTRRQRKLMDGVVTGTSNIRDVGRELLNGHE